MKLKSNIALTLMAVALLSGAVYFFVQYQKEQDKNNLLVKQLHELNDKEKKSTIVRSISTQMEEIAYQQKSVSDEQREQAVKQTAIANKMRTASDLARQKAIIAEGQAVESQHKALASSQTAEKQRRLADERRLQAEYAKRTADTLNAYTLARSLGSLAIQRYQAKNYTLGELLAYAAYYISIKYGKTSVDYDIYRALSLTSNSNTQWNQHQGGVMAIAVDPNNRNSFATVDSYGSVIMHKRNGVNVTSQTIVNSKTYDFRDVYIDENSNIYALSRNGQLYVKPFSGLSKISVISQTANMMRIIPYANDRLLLVADKALFVYDKSSGKVISSKPLSFSVTAVGIHGKNILLFDKNGTEYAVNSLQNIASRKMPFNDRVTAYAYSAKLRMSAYGTVDGKVYIARQGAEIQKLESHRSKISQLQFYGNRLFSSSYDGTVKFCDLSNSRMESSNAFTCNYWVHCMSAKISDDELWTGNQHGTVTRTLISTKAMAGKVKDNLERDFTKEEWDKYIGTFLPYTKFK